MKKLGLLVLISLLTLAVLGSISMLMQRQQRDGALRARPSRLSHPPITRGLPRPRPGLAKGWVRPGLREAGRRLPEAAAAPTGRPTEPPTPAATLDPVLSKMRYFDSFAAPDRSWLPAVRPGKYLVLDPDHGGFNNIRLAFEVAIVLALLTGRSLVIPADEPWYLLGRENRNYKDFFDMKALAGLVPCVPMAEFRAGQFKRRGRKHKIDFDPLHQIVGFPSEAAVRKAHSAAQLGRMKGSDRKLIGLEPGSYGWDADVLEVDNGRHRLLGTWHTFFVFADSHHDLALKRLMRNHVRYADPLWEIAAGAVRRMGGWGTYTAMHIRRGDFQYKETRLQAETLYKNVAPLLKRSGKKRLYISTDEKDSAFFQPFRDADQPVPFHHEGMLEQLMCVGSHLFVGTRLSTFSSYIMRLRGYTRGVQNKEIFYSDRRYSGDPERDGNEKKMDSTNSELGAGELAYFREPQNVWVLEDQS